jgi:Tol biopolymer transport system component
VRNLYIKASNGATNEQLLLKSPEEKSPTDWSRDGRFLLYSARDPKNGFDLWVLPMSPANEKGTETKPTPFLSTPFEEGDAHFSPDGRFVAYRSNESGRNEVYVRSFPDGSGKWQISRNGGAIPRWRGDGKELFFYYPAGTYMSVDITLAPAFQFGAEKRLFPALSGNVYDVAADGKRLLLADVLDTDTAANPIIVVLNALK